MSISRAQSSRIFPARACFQVLSVIANVLRRGTLSEFRSCGVLPHFPVRQVGNRSARDKPSEMSGFFVGYRSAARPPGRGNGSRTGKPLEELEGQTVGNARSVERFGVLGGAGDSRPGVSFRDEGPDRGRPVPCVRVDGLAGIPTGT